MDPPYHVDADPDPTFQLDADPDPQHWPPHRTDSGHLCCVGGITRWWCRCWWAGGASFAAQPRRRARSHMSLPVVGVSGMQFLEEKSLLFANAVFKIVKFL